MRTGKFLTGYLLLAAALVTASLPAFARQHHHSGGTLSLARYVDSLITQDSRGWGFNRYDHGSIYNVSVESGSSGSTYVIDADYTFNSGQQGWVKVSVVNNRFSCIEFWDEGTCRQLRSPLPSAGTSPGFSSPFGDNGGCKWWESDEGFGRCD
jgi:hypothetical protein